jgi:hypothetical protein
MARHFPAIRAAILPAIGLYACVWAAVFFVLTVESFL